VIDVNTELLIERVNTSIQQLRKTLCDVGANEYKSNTVNKQIKQQEDDEEYEDDEYEWEEIEF